MQHKHDTFDLDVKQLKEDGRFSGYASIFDMVDHQGDVVAKGAFAESVKNDAGKVKLLWQHKLDEPVGTITELREDEQGLYVEGQLLLDIAKGAEVYSMLKSGAIDSLSIGYKVKDAEFIPDTGVRVLREVELFEISFVTFPANQNARIRSVKCEKPETIRDFESFLREAGFSRTEAKQIVASGYKSLDQRDAEPVTMEAMIALDRSIDRAMASLTN